MNIVTIDPSLTCSGVIVNGKAIAYASETTAHSKSGKLVKWFEAVEHLAEFKFHDITKMAGNSHSTNEIIKLQAYDKIASGMASDIQALLIEGEDTKVYIEGYSYSSAAGPLIDLVTFGTLVRKHMSDRVSKDIQVITPSELKMYAARFTYPAVTGKAKEIIRNNDGISGGKFKKPEMYKALIENNSLQCEWVQMLRDNASDLLTKKSIPKPIEDLNDAKLMYEIAKANKYI